VIVYRYGNLTSANFTPREKDTVPGAGQTPGLSTWEMPPAGGIKAQKLDLRLLGPPLRAFPDKPHEGGFPGHVAIAPVDDSGELDTRALEDWAASRGGEQIHPLTQLMLDAVIQLNVKDQI
jgi:hypothetical protein